MAHALLYTLPLSARSYSLGASDWNYKDLKAWPDMCLSGEEQSPVEIARSKTTPTSEAGALSLRYPDVVEGVEVVDNQHGSPQINVPLGSAWVELDGARHDLVQIHFHCGREHVLEGVPADMEMHLVHSPPLVLGVLLQARPNIDIASNTDTSTYEISGDGAAVGPYSVLETALGRNGTRLSLTQVRDGLTEGTTSAYTYKGSLTTPPCSEGVRWIIDPVVRSIGEDQLFAFQEFRGVVPNARAVQQLGRRRVELINRVIAFSD